MGEQQDLVEINQLGQIFIKQEENEKIIQKVSNTVDAFLVAAPQGAITTLIENLRKRFDVGLVHNSSKISINECEIIRYKSVGAKIIMNRYTERLHSIIISRSRRLQQEAEVSEGEESVCSKLD